MRQPHIRLRKPAIYIYLATLRQINRMDRIKMPLSQKPVEKTPTLGAVTSNGHSNPNKRQKGVVCTFEISHLRIRGSSKDKKL